jgi:hypothetical protein
MAQGAVATRGQKTQGQKKQGQKKQGQGVRQGPQWIGHGTYTPRILGSWSKIEQRLLARGYSQKEVDFVYYVAVCPKGHEDHMTQTAAARKLFPKVSAITAKCRVLNCVLDFMQQLTVGQHVDEYQEAWDEAHPKPLNTGTRPRLSVEERAERIATKELTKAFRKSNNLKARGRLKPDMAEKLDRHLKKFLPSAIKKTVVELSAE